MNPSLTLRKKGISQIDFVLLKKARIFFNSSGDFLRSISYFDKFVDLYPGRKMFVDVYHEMIHMLESTLKANFAKIT